MSAISSVVLRGPLVAAVAGGLCTLACSSDPEPPATTSAVAALSVEELREPCTLARNQCWDDYTSSCGDGTSGSQDSPACQTLRQECERWNRVCQGYDDSAAPVYTHVKTCVTPAAARQHEEVTCRLDPEFALVGGGARTVTYHSGSYHPKGAFLTESRPLEDGRTWQASSSDHLLASPHDLIVYAIGMRLEGANSQQLREAIEWKEVTLAGSSATLRVDSGRELLSGGAQALADPGSAGRLLTATHFTGYHEWKAGSADHLLAVEGSTTVWQLELEDRIFEGFGALEIKQLIAHSVYAARGAATSSVRVEPGWALIGMGGAVVSDPNGAGRMLSAIAPEQDNRTVSVTSSDYLDSSAGTTTAYAIMARKYPGSHGLCNPGTKLEPRMDSCVAEICSRRSECCSDAWDGECVDLVPEVCQRSCAEHTCHTIPYEPERWNRCDPDEPECDHVPSNCMYYALNKYPDGGEMHPGATLNMLPTDIWGPAARQYALIEGEGLIPTTHDGTCPENRTKVQWQHGVGHQGGLPDHHWLRQDASGSWSEKTIMTPVGLVMETLPDGSVAPFKPKPVEGNKGYFCTCNQPLPQGPPPFDP